MRACFLASSILPARGLLGLVLVTVSTMGVAQEARVVAPESASATGESHEQRAALARQLRETIEQLQSVRERFRRADQQHQDRLGAIQRQIDVLHNQLQPAGKSLETTQQEIDRLEGEISQQQEVAANAQAWIDLAGKLAQPIAERARQRIAQGAGNQQSRRTAALDEVLRKLDEADPERKLEGVRSLVGLFGEEWLPARSVTLANETVRLDGGQRLEHAWVVELGLFAKAFVSEEGGLVGVWRGDAKDPWELDLPESTRGQVRDLLNIVRERKAPAVTTVPVYVASDDGKK